jgi:predicted Na+-dependent transporter
MNDFAKRNFNLILFLSTVAGFLLPEFGEISGILILGVLSLIIFSSSFKVNFSIQFFKDRAALIFSFYLIRFILLPVACFYLILPFSPFYASSVFLLFVLPAGVTAPAFTNVFGGNVALALVLLILSSFLTPIVLPILSGVLMTEVLNINQSRLFFTLFITVIFPYIAHLPFRKNRDVTNWMQNHDIDHRNSLDFCFGHCRIKICTAYATRPCSTILFGSTSWVYLALSFWLELFL